MTVIAEEKMKEAVGILSKMGARRIILFGSYLAHPHEARDIDIEVEGIPLTKLLDADAAVYDILRVPLDLVSKEENPSFYAIAKSRGTILYESA